LLHRVTIERLGGERGRGGEPGTGRETKRRGGSKGRTTPSEAKNQRGGKLPTNGWRPKGDKKGPQGERGKARPQEEAQKKTSTLGHTRVKKK